MLKKLKRLRKFLFFLILIVFCMWHFWGGETSSNPGSRSAKSRFLFSGNIARVFPAVLQSDDQTTTGILPLTIGQVGHRQTDKSRGILPTLYRPTLGSHTNLQDCSSPTGLQPSAGVCLPFWQRRALNQSQEDSGRKKPYYVSELLHVRIYPRFDKAKWTIRELKQWIHFILLTGVEHIYICNHFIYEDERIEVHLKRYIELKLVTCIPWKEGEPWSTENQIDCYKHFIETHRGMSVWHIDVDMDEYPWNPGDHEEGFLVRYIHEMELRHGDQLTEISMDNYLMMGQGNRSEDMTISRINRMTPLPANGLVKPIFRPDRVDTAMHMNHILIGKAVWADPAEMRLVHFWGARTQNWGPDTEETRNRTIIMNSFRQTWAAQLRNSLLAFGEKDAFSNSTGP